jgi:peptidoglycan/xylan/chitin deacetylase (PgdA/CDA1 family)
MIRRLKPLALRALTHPICTASLGPLMQGRAAIFMLHRFAQPDLGVQGHDPQMLRTVLAWLRREHYELVPLADLFRRLAGEAPPFRRAVCFTIDDGYLDHATIGSPVFAEFDCPVTTFVTTGFLDQQLWFWWDRIEWIFAQSMRGRGRVVLGGVPLEYRWGDADERARAQADFTARCKEVPDLEKGAAIMVLAHDTEVELPALPPPPYRPMSWDQLRECETRGMTFGPHTVTHPVLSRTSDEQSNRELEESWSRLKEEATQPVPVFCYPNGQMVDFGTRETATLRRIGLHGAVTGVEGYADVRAFDQSIESPFRTPRFSYAESLPHMIQYVSGLEWIKQRIRRRGAP